MKDGFIKVAAGGISVVVADPDANAVSIVEQAAQAAQQGVKLLVLPELCLTGYTCQDLFYSDMLIHAAMSALADIAAATGAMDLILCVGMPIRFAGKLFDCAVVLQRGRVLGVVPKVHLPNFGEANDSRVFASAFDNGDVQLIDILGESVPFGTPILFRSRTMPDFAFGVEIGSDLWAMDPPGRMLAQAGATVIVNLSASAEMVGRADYRRMLTQSTSARLISGYVMANACDTESTQDLVFSGHHLIAENGTILAENPPFGAQDMIVSEIDTARMAGERRRNTDWPAHSEVCLVEFDQAMEETTLTRPVEKNPFVPACPQEADRRAESILQMQSRALKKRLEHTHAKTIVLGISGGLDSCLAMLVAARAMDLCGRSRKDILAVTMPCFGTSSRTRSNAGDMCDLLGVTMREVNICESVRLHFKDIGHDEAVRDVTYENSQARERTQVLMDLANETGGMVLGTGDLSELALGWATYNGDHMSMYGVNGSIPKTLVRCLVRYEAEMVGGELARVLLDIVDTPVSPELLPADGQGKISQKTEDLVGPYELHDFFIYYALRFGFTPAKIFRLAKYVFAGEYDAATILHWLRTFFRRFFAQQFKRSCLPDGVKVGSAGLSPRGDWRMPSDAVSRAWLAQIDTLQA